MELSKPLTWRMLLLATAVSAKSALAQTEEVSAEGEVDVAMPGVVISGTRERDIQRATTEVVSVPRRKISREWVRATSPARSAA